MLKAALLSILIPLTSAKQIVIAYAGQNQVELFKYFNGIEQEFYVDIGAGDPVAGSTTIGLYVNGWEGISIDQFPRRVNRFNFVRRVDNNVAAVIGERNKFIEVQDKKNRIQYVGDKSQSSPSSNIIQIQSLGLDTICQYYFQKKPKYLHIDLSTHHKNSLQSNNWTSLKCRPQVIFLKRPVASPQPSSILVQNNYTLMSQSSAMIQVYVLKDLVARYEQNRGRNGLAVGKDVEFVDLDVVEEQLGGLLGVKVGLGGVYEPRSAEVYLVFSRVYKALNINFLRQQAKKYHKDHQDRPILILNHNPHKTPIVIPCQTYTITELTSPSTPSISAFKLTIHPAQKPSYTAYIFNHRYSPQLQADQFPILVSDPDLLQALMQDDQWTKTLSYIFYVVIGLVVVLGVVNFGVLCWVLQGKNTMFQKIKVENSQS